MPGQSVAGILDLQAIIFDNKEVGFNWRGDRASFGGSYYKSNSDLGASLAMDPVTQDFILIAPAGEIDGYEFTADIASSPNMEGHRPVLAHTRQDHCRQPNGPLNVEMGVVDISPDKFGARSSGISWSAARVTARRDLAARTRHQRRQDARKSIRTATRCST